MIKATLDKNALTGKNEKARSKPRRLWRVAGILPGKKIGEEKLLRRLVPDSFWASFFGHGAG